MKTIVAETKHQSPIHCTVLYCSVLYCSVLYCSVLYCIALEHKAMSIRGFTNPIHSFRSIIDAPTRSKWCAAEEVIKIITRHPHLPLLHPRLLLPLDLRYPHLHLVLEGIVWKTPFCHARSPDHRVRLLSTVNPHFPMKHEYGVNSTNRNASPQLAIWNRYATEYPTTRTILIIKTNKK